MFQKRYLQCQLDAFYQTQQAALVMMKDMGAPVDPRARNTHSASAQPYARFRVVGHVVIATLRFQYFRKRTMKCLKAKIGRSSMSGTAAHKMTGNGYHWYSSSRHLHGHPTMSLPGSIDPRATYIQPHLSSQHITSSSSLVLQSSSTLQSGPLTHSSSKTVTTPVAAAPSSASMEVGKDPQLAAYISGLQRLQSRLSKRRTTGEQYS